MSEATFAPKKYEEFRGVSDIVIAPLITDSPDELTYGEVIDLAGISEISKETETSQESHFYDNVAALVASGEGADNYTVKLSALDLQRLALISGRYYDPATDMLVETPRTTQYFAVGYKTGITGDSGDHDRYVWKYKCQFNMPKEIAKTKTNDSQAEGQEIEFVSIFTNKRFTIKGEEKAAKGLVVANTGKADLSTFFKTVTTPDQVKAKDAQTT